MTIATGRIYGRRLKTFLHLACKYSTSLSLIRYLVETRSMNPHVPLPRTGVTCLHYASGGGCLQIVKYLVERCRCDVNAKGPYGVKALTVAVRLGREEVVRYLLPRTQESCAPGRQKWTIAHWAAHCGNVCILELIGKPRWTGRTAQGEDISMLAAKANHRHVLHYLISTGYLNLSNSIPFDLLESINSNWELVEWLLRKTRKCEFLPSLLRLKAPLDLLKRLCSEEFIDLGMIIKHDRVDLLSHYLLFYPVSSSLLPTFPCLPPQIAAYFQKYRIWQVYLPFLWLYETLICSEIGSNIVIWSRLPKTLVREIAAFI